MSETDGLYRKDSLSVRDGSPYSPHNITPSLIPPNTVVLDVGCNVGLLGETLKSKNVITDGIDINEEALKRASVHYRQVYRRDLYQSKLDLPEKNQYDYIVFGDVLEHVPRPDLLLMDVRKHLKPDGRIIVSLPNVARFEIRLGLLFGQFKYGPGILSEDHLRFYTRDTGMELIRNCGYIVERTLPTGLGARFRILPTLTAFQFIHVCRLK